MTSALALLIGAMQLLTVVSTTPNISSAFKAQAIEIAQYAITVAQAELAARPQPTPEPLTAILSPVLPTPTLQPTFSGIIVPMDQSDLTVEDLGKVGNADPINGIPHGTWFIKASVLDAEGKNVRNATITLTTGIYVDERKTDSISTLNGEDYHRIFSFDPPEAGSYTLTFTSGAHTKQITIQVE